MGRFRPPIGRTHRGREEREGKGELMTMHAVLCSV